MALPTNTVTSYTSVGQREDLSDIIYNVSRMDTPFVSNIDREEISAKTPTWQTDVLRAAAANAKLEGDDATVAAVTPTTLVGNYCQILSETISVSGTDTAVKHAGRKNEFEYQIVKSGKQLKRDLEFALTQNAAAVAGNATVARKLAGLESWLATNKTSVGTGSPTTPGAAGSPAIPTTAPTDATAAGAFTKASVDTVVESIYSNSNEAAEGLMLMVGPFNRGVISGFSGISTLQTDANMVDKVTLIGAVDFYKSNFGVIKVVANNFQRAKTALIVNAEYFSLGVLRPMVVEELAKTGDSQKSHVLTEVTLISRNEKASGKVTDLTTS